MNSSTTFTLDCSSTLVAASLALRAARRANNRIAGCGGRQIQVRSHAVQAPGVLEGRQLNAAHLLGWVCAGWVTTPCRRCRWSR